VIVQATEQQLEEIKKNIISKLEEFSVPQELKVWKIPIKYANVEEVANVLADFFRTKRNEARSAGLKGVKPTDIVTIKADPASRTLIVWATEENKKLIDNLLADLDKEGVSPRTRKAKTFRLQYADPGSVANAINAAFRVSGRVSEAERVQAVPEWGTLSVVVTANEEKMKEIEKLVTELDNPDTASQRQTIVVPLQHARATELADTINRTLSQTRLRTRRGQLPVAVVADDATNSLVITANKKELDNIKQLVQTLDVPAAASKGRVVKAFKLNYADPYAAASAINAAFRTPGRWDPREYVQAAGEWATNSVIVSAPEDKFKEIENFIKELDSVQTEQLRQTKVIPIKNARAVDLANTLNRTLSTTMRRTRRGTLPISIVADESTNSLIVTARQQEFEQLEQIIKTLDVPPAEAKDRIVKAFKLQFADCYAVANAINRLFALRGRVNPRDVVQAAGEWGSNTVVVSASPEKMKQVEDVVKQMDQETASKRKTHVVELKYADASEIYRALREVYMWSRGWTRRGTPTVVISYAQGTNRLLISAPDKEYQEISKMIAELDQPTQVDKAIVSVLPLKYTDANEMLGILREYLRKPGRAGRSGELEGGVRLSIAQSQNALVVTGSKEYVDRISEMVRQLDQPLAESATAPKIIRLKNARATELARTLQQVFTNPARQMARRRRGQTTMVPVIVADEATNSLIVRAPASDMALIEKMVAQVDAQTSVEPTGVKIIPVATGIDVRNLAREIERTINQGERYRAQQVGRRPALVSIGVDERSNSLIVSGSPEQFAEVERLVKQLEALKPAGPVKVRIIQLRSIGSQEVQRVLDQLLKRSSQGRFRRPRGRYRGDAGDLLKPADGYAAVRPAAVVPLAMAVAMFGQVVPAAADAPQTQRAAGVATQPASRVAGLPSEDKAAASRPAEAGGAVERVIKSGLLKGLVVQPEPAEPLKPVDVDKLSGAVEYAPLDESTIILQGSEEDLALLERLIRLLDRGVPRPVVRVFTLKNAQAAQLGPQLNAMFQRISRVPGRRPRPEDIVSIIADARSNSLIVAASPERMKEIEDLINKLDLKPLIGEVEIHAYPLKNIRASEAATMLQNLIRRLQQQRGLRAADQITITADDRTNTLLITAPKPDLRQIEKLIGTIDVPPAFATADIMIFQLRNADAQNLANVLAQMISVSAQAGRRGRRGVPAGQQQQIRRLRLRTPDGKQLPDLDLEKPIRIIPEPGTNSVLVSSNAENLKAVGEIIKLLDGYPITEAVKVWVFPLQHADANELADLLRQTFQQGKTLGQRPTAGRRRAGAVAVPESTVGKALAFNVAVLADVRTNTLIVAGREDALALAEQIVLKLDRPGIGLKWPVRIFALKHADAQRIAVIIQQLMDRRLQALQRVGRTALERERVFIFADPRSNSLIISAKDDNYQEVVDLAKRLDEAPTALIDQIRIITLNKTQANVLAPKIEQLWQRRAALRRVGGVPEDRPVIVADERSNALIIASNQEDFEAIKRLVDALEKQPLAPIAEIRIVQLKNNDAASIGPTLQQLFDKRLQMRLTPGQQPLPSDRVAIAVDAATNSLLVAASRENYDLLVKLVKQLDVEPAVEGIVRLFTLQNADARQVAETIRDLFQQGLYKPGLVQTRSPIVQAREKVAIAVDDRSNTLIISASRENFSIIETLIKRMDSPEAPFLAGNLELIQLQHSDAVKMAGLLQDLFDRMRQAMQATGRKVTEMPAVVIPDERSNTLIISASRDGLARAKALLARLDREVGPPTAEFRVYPLKEASAQRLEQIVRDLFQKRAAGGRAGQATPVQVYAEPSSNSLVVSASREDHALLENLLTLLDVPSKAAEQIQIFPLEKAQASAVVDTLKSLYADQGKTVVAFTADERSNSIVVRAAPGEMRGIAEVIKRLDTAEPQVELGLRWVQLKRADAEEMAQMLNDFLQIAGRGGGRVSQADRTILINFKQQTPEGEELLRKLIRQDIHITADPRTNTLLVMAPAETVDVLVGLIESLDNITPITVEIEVFQLRNADATEVVDTLEKLFGIGQAARRGRGTTEEQRQLTLGQGVAAAGLLTGLAGGAVTAGGRPILSLTVDTRTNSVIAAGSREYLLLVRQLIEQLDSQDIEVRVNKVYAVRYTDAETLAESLRTYFEREAQRLRELGQDIPAQRRIEQEVSVVPDKESNKLLISVSPRLESQIMEMVRELDQPPPQVMIQVLMAEVTLDERLELGVEFTAQDLLFTEKSGGTGFGPGQDVVIGTDLGAAGPAGSLGGFSFTITSEDFSFLLRALQTDGRLEVLSRPQIMVLDNQKATINVGENVPYVSGATITTTGDVQTVVGRQDVGIKLEVTPHITPDDFVRLQVRPEISSLAESTVQLTEGLRAPVFTQRFAETTVTIKNGETVVIGGLITTREETGTSKVPLIGDLPVIGWLFKSFTDRNQKTELLIVLTPRIVRSTEDMRRISIEERDKADILPEELKQSPLFDGLRVVPPEERGRGEPSEEFGVEERVPSSRPARETIYGPEPILYGPLPPGREVAGVAAETSDAAAVRPTGADYLYQRR